MSNRNFIIHSILFIFLIGIFFLLLKYSFYKVPKSSLWIQNCFIKKDGYALSINDKKIVFTSGSNSLYGMETNIIEDTLGIPTVNMAIHAGLKTDYILYRTKNILKSGDIVILPLEYQNYLWNGEEESTRTGYILTHDKNYFLTELDFYEQLSLLLSVKPFDLGKSFKEKFQLLKEQEIGKGYTSVTLNKNGDETYKNGILSKKHEPFELQKSFIETKGLSEIVKFSKWCKKNRIKLFITFPNTINHTEYYKEPYTSYFENLISFFKNNDIYVIGKPTDFLYSKNYFYDTNYHMNSIGAKIRTFEFLQILEENYPKDFGVLVTKENIDKHLQNLKSQIKAYDLNTTLEK
jgi:hypothetical protein